MLGNFWASICIPWNSYTLSSAQTMSSRYQDIFSKIFIMGVLCTFKVLLYLIILNCLVICKGYFSSGEIENMFK